MSSPTTSSLNTGSDDADHQLSGSRRARLRSRRHRYYHSRIDHLIPPFDQEEPGDPRDDRLPEVGPAVASTAIYGTLARVVIYGDTLRPEPTTAARRRAGADRLRRPPIATLPIDGNLVRSRQRHQPVAIAAGGARVAGSQRLQPPCPHYTNGAVHFHLYRLATTWPSSWRRPGAYTSLKHGDLGQGQSAGPRHIHSRHELVSAFRRGSAPRRCLSLASMAATEMLRYRRMNRRQVGAAGRADAAARR